MRKPEKAMTAVFVGSDSSVPVVRRVHDAFEHVERTRRIDIIDPADRAQVPMFSEQRQLRIRDSLSEKNAVLILGITEWGETNLTESISLLYASGSHNHHEPVEAAAICLITNSLDNLDILLSPKRTNFERRDKVRLVAVYGQEGGYRGQKAFEFLIRRFHNLQKPDFLCFKAFDDKAAKLVTSRICSLV